MAPDCLHTVQEGGRGEGSGEGDSLINLGQYMYSVWHHNKQFTHKFKLSKSYYWKWIYKVFDIIFFTSMMTINLGAILHRCKYFTTTLKL